MTLQSVSQSLQRAGRTENYIPELRLAIEILDRLNGEAKVKGYICEKQGIRYIWVPLKRKDSLTGGPESEIGAPFLPCTLIRAVNDHINEQLKK